ncbi:hypothetical protein PVAR5_3984 [Paecilomyces variotii No. 5]|uniref:Uncharacterized protein n=1 Tax=Byssochlamys spectabilis (strain No. 5 / NBRC 109023) TaxID=1356009 RepID=V5G383_BYSSN|nr:hypothetical protein PVAR5_3984 [Paecilomyces variotii No. 5]
MSTLGEEEDFMSFDIIPSFSPEEISRSTFTRLLKCYPTTVREVYRDKLLSKYEGTRKKVKKSPEEPVVVPEKQVEKDLDAFLKLDEWRYEVLPGKMRERREEGKKEGVFIEKEELVQLMEWKLKHGVFRPTLLGLVKSNQAPLVRKTTSAAFAALPSAGDGDDAAFPKASLDALTEPLRGVGPATASLILCAGTGLSGSEIQVPFFSDEIYQWLCLDCYPSAEQDGEGKGDADSDDDDDDKEEERKKPPKKKNGELIIKYNMAEYKNVWDAVSAIRERLNRTAKPDSAVEDEKRIFSAVDVEKVAFVLGNIDLSGYFGEPKSREERRNAVRATTPPKGAQKRKAEVSKEEKFRAKKRRIKAKHERREAKKKRTGRNN